MILAAGCTYHVILAAGCTYHMILATGYILPRRLYLPRDISRRSGVLRVTRQVEQFVHNDLDI